MLSVITALPGPERGGPLATLRRVLVLLRGKPGRPARAELDLILFSLSFAVLQEASVMAAVPPDDVSELAAEYAGLIERHGDLVLALARRGGDAYDSLARGLTALALQPGGLDFAGHHWEVSCATPSG